MLSVGGTSGSKAVGRLRRKSWQLITLNRFFQKSGERQQLTLDTEANKQLATDVKAELQLLQEEARNTGRLSSGFASHQFQNGDKYDGEWKEGTMNGKGVFKFKNGNEYAGFWEANKRQGQGVFSNAQTGTKYEGQWQLDKRHGRGKFTDREGNCFEGAWKNNEMCGQGSYKFINGDNFEGQFERNDFNGKGKFKYGNGDFYDGDWRDGKCHGNGVFNYPAIDHRYEGQWQNDKKHGRGTYTAPDYIYEGEWRDDAMSGMGTYSYPNGDRYVGEWLDNEEHGQGCFYHADGSKFDGYFGHGKRAGWGVFASTDGSRYEGNWKDNVKSGQGTYTYPNGDKYAGGWANDVMHGTGTYTYKTGKRYKVEYDNGKCINKQKLEGSFNDGAQTARPPAEDFNNYSSTYKQGVASARGNSLMPASNTGNDWALDKLPVSPSALPNSRPNSAMYNNAPSPPTTTNHTTTPRVDNSKATEQFLESARANIASLFSALDDPAAADPTIADQARDDMQKAMKMKSSTSIPAVLKAELNEVSDHLAELLEMWDDAFTQAQQNALPVETEADKARKERLRQEEEAAKQREREREDTKKKMEELRQKRKADAEVKLLEAQLDEMKRQRESEEKKQQQQEELHKKMMEQAAELERLKREADKAKESANALDILRQQIENEKNRRTNPANETTDEERLRLEAERLEAQKLSEIERQRREADKKVKEQADALRRQMEEEYNAKIDHVKSRLESENNVPTLTAEERKELEAQYAREYESQMDDLHNQLKKAEANEDRPLAADEVMMELDRLKRLYEKEQDERKKIYNELVDMKGSIRVYVRVRPMSEKERATRGGVDSVEFPSDSIVTILGEDGKKAKEYTFDRVFPMSTTQIQVFADTLPIITSVVDGYNTCIFAYGQTGSGKTWTMNGIPENPGVMRRSITELFRIIQERSSVEECEVNAAVLEVYNEEIRDLLIPRNAQKKYSVKTDPLAGQYVDNLTYRAVRVPNDIEYCMSQAEAHRTANATNMNAHSSRSHMLLYIVLSIMNKQTHSKIVSKLSLIDLAGSERIAKSGVTGQALKEAQHINKSLSALGDVIASLKTKGSHTPYRNSVLTHLLQDSLGGKAKTLMFANISPLSGDFSETISTLEFANRTRGIQLGKAKKNISAT